MRICLFRAFPDAYRKSMEIYADQLLKGIRPLLREDEEIVGCLPEGVRLRPRYVRYWDQYVRYQRLCKGSRGDVNHIVDHGYGHLARSLPARRVVVTFHDSVVTRVRGVALSTRLSLRYSLHAIRQVAAVVAISETSRRDFLALVDYPPDRVRVVYLGIDPAFRVTEDCGEWKRRYALPDSYLLHVGHNLPYANLDAALLTLDALARAHGIDARLVKVGAAFTPTQEALLDERGLRARVTHLGSVPLADLPAIYSSAAVLLYPVLYAGFGWPPLEAMACGTPVVCSNRGALPEVLGDAALMVEPDDHDQMAVDVARLMTDKRLRESYRAKGLARARRYDWSRTARQMLDIYRELAHG
jgi:glycosyltransferase involved in cell wall biosynthesis